jgi:hypothetical protein
MSFIVKDESNFKSVAPGNYLGICYQLIDLGTQTGEYKGQKTVKKQMIVSWELSNEKMENGDPYVQSNFYTRSLGEKANLRQDLESWRGRPFTQEELNSFDLETLVGVPCMLNIVDNKGKSKIAAITRIPKEMQNNLPTLHNPKKIFDIKESPKEDFDALSSGIQNIIAKSPEFKEVYEEVGETLVPSQKEGKEVECIDDEIPF